MQAWRIMIACNGYIFIFSIIGKNASAIVHVIAHSVEGFTSFGSCLPRRFINIGLFLYVNIELLQGKWTHIVHPIQYLYGAIKFHFYFICCVNKTQGIRHFCNVRRNTIIVEGFWKFALGKEFMRKTKKVNVNTQNIDVAMIQLQLLCHII